MMQLFARRRPRRSSGERGAAALEFALVAPLLCGILFGIVQYGFYFGESLAAEQAVRQGARTGVVLKSDPSCGGGGWAAIRCTVQNQVGADTSDSFVKVTAPLGWERGNPLLVCVILRSRGDTGLLPLPHDGYIHAGLRMSIEQVAGRPSGSGSADQPPPGQDWSWCA